MTDGPSLLRAILEHPGDTTVRLVYADWLDENGDGERAELIRVQVAMARFPETHCGPCIRETSPCRPCVLRARSSALLTFISRDVFWLSLSEDGWTENGTVSVRGTTLASQWRFLWDRGFAHYLRCPFAGWQQHGVVIVSQHPIQLLNFREPQPVQGVFALDALNAARKKIGLPKMWKKAKAGK